MNKAALISVSDKSGLEELAVGLIKQGFELVSTGGTCRAIHQMGIDVTPVSEVTMFPEMMDGRVKTLHPKIHGGILARRSNAQDLAQVHQHGIKMFDVVVVNHYPFAKTAANPNATAEQLIEDIDIGGPSLIRAAAKNFQNVLVLTDPADYSDAVRHALSLPTWHNVCLRYRFQMALKAFAHTAAYDAAIASELPRIEIGDNNLLTLKASAVKE